MAELNSEINNEIFDIIMAAKAKVSSIIRTLSSEQIDFSIKDYDKKLDGILDELERILYLKSCLNAEQIDKIKNFVVYYCFHNAMPCELFFVNDFLCAKVKDVNTCKIHIEVLEHGYSKNSCSEIGEHHYFYPADSNNSMFYYNNYSLNDVILGRLCEGINRIYDNYTGRSLLECSGDNVEHYTFFERAYVDQFAVNIMKLIKEKEIGRIKVLIINNDTSLPGPKVLTGYIDFDGKTMLINAQPCESEFVTLDGKHKTMQISL